MRFARVLVAVDDSPAGLDAARTAADLAGAHSGVLRAVTVTPVDARASVSRGSDENRSLLRWVVEMAADRQVACEVAERAGEPFREILQEAQAWPADVVVMGRSDRRGPSSPYLGSVTAHVLEFADCPVLVVPQGVDPPG